MLQTQDEATILQRLKDTPEIFREISDCSAEERKNQKRLRLRYDDELVRAALTVYEARVRARELLPAADDLWLNRVGLEQATAWHVARYKAQRFAPEYPVFDLCSGIGVDSAAIAERVDVVSLDSDPAMCLRCAWNVAVWSPSRIVTVRCEDITQRDWSGTLVHVDPDRRAGRDRPVKRLEQYQPNLAWLQQLTAVARGGAIKLGPASNFMQKFPGCEIELISLNGECREATVWFGELAGKHSFRATALSANSKHTPQSGQNDFASASLSVHSVTAEPLSEWSSQAREVGNWIFDPDPAVVRSGMLDVVAVQQGFQRLDPEEEYLTADHQIVSGFVTPFQVECVLPNSLRELRHFLRQDPSRFYEIKCRRIPVQAAVIQRQLPTGVAEPRVILFARVGGVAKIVVSRRRSSGNV